MKEGVYKETLGLTSPGVMWGGNQRIARWIKWWVCFADAVGSNLEWAGNLLRKCLIYAL